MTEWILSSSILILIVIALRTCFKGKISLRLQYAIWGLVLLRLLLPINIGSTIFSVANFTSSTEPSDVVINTVDQNTMIENNTITVIPQEQTNQMTQQHTSPNAPVPAEKTDKIGDHLLNVIWAVGFVSVAVAFLLTNIRFRKRITNSRSSVGTYKKKLKVYATDKIDTPCLVGAINPEIYVTPEVTRNRTLLRHTVIHEATHYRHGDHVWAVLRCVCLALHWYNPLVWWAAFLSQRDGELACDEGAISRLGEGERAEYGRTLIGMTCQKKPNVLMTATTMTTGKRGLKERIVLIAKKPKMAVYAVVTVLLVSVIAVGCTFTGPRPDGQGAYGEILDENGEVIATKDLEDEAIPTESTGPTQETQPAETEPTEETLSGPVIVLPGGEMLHERIDQNKICIAVQPTGLVSEGGAYLYIIPEDQETLSESFAAASATAHTYTKWDSSNKRAGWWIVYQDMWWQVTESGAMFGIDQETFNGVTIDSEDAKELYAFCDAAVKEVGIREPVRPEDITEIKSATLYWNGEHKVTDEYALNRIEKWLVNSREEGSVSCWFTAQLVLELENGESKTISMATDSCATWMSEGVAYGFGEITEDGIKGNEEFYSLFASSVIRERSKDGMDALADYWIYLDWGRYANAYGPDETFALMDQFKEFVISAPYDWNMATAIRATQGLDGAYADYYSGVLADLFEADKATFSFACLGMASDPDEAKVLEMLAYHWNITPAEAREKLESERKQN